MGPIRIAYNFEDSLNSYGKGSGSGSSYGSGYANGYGDGCGYGEAATSIYEYHILINSGDGCGCGDNDDYNSINDHLYGNGHCGTRTNINHQGY